MWGDSNMDEIEIVQNNFSKFLLGVRQKSPNIRALAELGLLPYKKFVIYRILKYWLRIVTTDIPILKKSYNLLILRRGKTWCDFVKTRLNLLDFSIFMINQGVENVDAFLIIRSYKSNPHTRI